MKKIMISAYTNFNLGDDLFIKVLCERYPNTRFVLLAPRKYKRSFKESKNLNVYSTDSFLIRGIDYLLRKIKVYNFYRKLLSFRCDAIVQIGGSLFIQSNNWTETLKIKE